jgi:hypothetical protein
VAVPDICLPQAAPCGGPTVPHLHRYYGFIRSLGIHPCRLRFLAAARTLDLAEDVLSVRER